MRNKIILFIVGICVVLGGVGIYYIFKLKSTKEVKTDEKDIYDRSLDDISTQFSKVKSDSISVMAERHTEAAEYIKDSISEIIESEDHVTDETVEMDVIMDELDSLME